MRFVKVLPEVRREMDLDEVVAAELVTWNKLMPPRWADRALVGSESEVVSWFGSLARRELELDAEEVLLARKLGRGARPIALLGLKERLLYRGAVSVIEVATCASDRSREAFDAFQQGPLEFEDCAYVLKTDIASYYQYVDHERLVDEVVAQTGDDLAVTLAVDLLHEVTARRFGLPQLSPVSDGLAEIYIDPMRRDLVRRGYRVSRFADDFRVACRDYDEALAALEATEHAARDLGLVLNELKTSTPGRERYRASLTATQDRERELFAELDVEELEDPEPGEYSDEDSSETVTQSGALLEETDFDEADVGAGQEPDDDDVVVSPAQLAAAAKVLEIWIEEEEDDEVQRAEPARITAALLGRALRVFTRCGDPSALEHVTAMLVYEPSLTPTIGRYLRRCAESARRLTRGALDEVCRSRAVSAWQAMWIAFIAGELPRRRGGETLPHVEWLRAQTRSDRPALAAEAILALARRRLVSASDVLDVLHRLPALHRPTALLALAALGQENLALTAADSELDRIRVRWGLEHL